MRNGKYPDGSPSLTIGLGQRSGLAARQIEWRFNERIQMEFIWFILIGLVAGWLAGRILKGRGFGIIRNLIVGVIGAMLGGFLFELFGLTATSLMGRLVMATVGAIVLLVLLQAIAGSRRRR
jgi:uncharacterized membrane protein YeaQ/YmgE (transglycosylase-associated protein family)